MENELLISPPLMIVNGYENFLIINIIKYVCLVALIALAIVIVFKILKHKKVSNVLIIFTVILVIISGLAFFTDIYDNTMRMILPYYYGI